MIDTHMIQASLVGPVAKLDIKDLLKSSPPPSPPLSTQPPPNSRSISVPSSYPPCIHMPSSSSMSSTSNYSASTAPPSTYTQHEQQYTRQLPPQPVPQSSTAQAVFQDNPKLDSGAESAVSNKRQLPTDEDSTCSPAKRGIKWSSAENVKVTRLRGRGTKWDDISRQIPGRSPTSCRLHYQNYLERRSQWDEEKKNRLARVYDRLKSEMWKDIANELGVPWRSAEAMHWAIGEQGMAQRANVTPFTMAAARAEPDEPASGRVAQRDRMLESTRVFEGQDLGTLNSSFSSVNANGNSHHYIPAGPYGIHPSTHVHIAPIKSENSFNGFDDEESQGDDEDDDGSKARKRRSGSGIRLPGLAQLDGEVQAIAKRERDGLVAADRYDGRRGSAASSGSSGSNGSNGTGGSG